ncbi:MAG: ATP-grasp domain-containing protein [Clostridia bacterium]|nr:ATP-grasp domain-containing protein [Clostridia bacterium]
MERIGVFFGGKSCEHEVSVITALQAMAELEYEYEIYPVYITEYGWFTGEKLKYAESYKNFNEKLHTKIILDGKKLVSYGKFGFLKVVGEIDVAFLCMHGGAGEGGGLAGMLEMYDVPYTSSSILPSSICLNKQIFKVVAREKGFRVVPGICVSKNDFLSNEEGICDKIISKYGLDVIVKPVDMGSSVGVNAPQNKNELKDALSLVFCYTNKALVEKKISNMIELNCAGVRFGSSVIVSAIEKPLKRRGEVLSYRDKYLSKSKERSDEREIPADISPRLASKIRKTTQKLYEEFDLVGVVRVDYMYQEDTGELYVNEVNTIPGSMSGYLFEECELDYSCLAKGMIEYAKDREREKEEYLTHYSSELLSGNYFVAKS